MDDAQPNGSLSQLLKYDINQISDATVDLMKKYARATADAFHSNDINRAILFARQLKRTEKSLHRFFNTVGYHPPTDPDFPLADFL